MRRRRFRRAGARRVTVVLGVVLAALVLPAAAASAHPLGNFTVNNASALRVQSSQVLVDSVLDLAEIPTSQAHAAVVRQGQDGWRDSQCAVLSRRGVLTVDGRAVALRVRSDQLSFLPGAGGLDTTRLVCRLSGSVDVRDGSTVTFASGAGDGHIGWREITAQGDGMRVQADVPALSASRMLTAYPADLLTSPLDVQTTTMRVTSGGPRAADPLTGVVPPSAAAARGVDQLTTAFTSFVGRRHLGVGLGALALLLSLLLGAVHALAPGHGKTVMAAFLASDRGSLRQVSAIGLTVTATHTLGVLLLGVALSLSTTFSPEKVYPWLGLISGLLLAGIGVNLLRAARQRFTAARAHDHPHGHDHPHDDHDHPHGHDHPHDDHDHPHEHDDDHLHDSPALTGGVAVLARPAPAPVVHSHGGRAHSHAPIEPGPIRTRSLLAMGLAGGLVPSPSALVVLLGAIALHRAWFGVLLVLVYGAGMATTLVGIGAMLARARGRFTASGRSSSWAWLARTSAVLPGITATLIVVIGVFLTLRAGVQLL